MDRAVHEVRTRVKQSRALLRLVRAALGEVGYQRARRALRQVNHSLAGLRDAKVTLAAYDKYQQHPDRGRSDIRRTRLLAQLAAARSQLSVSTRRAAATQLALVQNLVAGSPRSNAGWKAVARAIRHEYAGGHRALAAARSELSAANLHELRKRSKGLMYLCDFLRKLSPRANSLITPLKHIAACLGDDHDLVLLNRAIRSADLVRRTARKQIALRKKAWQLGARIYRDAPSVFTKHIHRQWRRRR
jgi:CHAD domain-containing protein